MSRVMLLEDHPRLAELIRRALTSAGIACDVWSTIAHAHAALREQAYAAALIDRGLPDGDGLLLVRQWRATGEHLPCLILTARDALHDRVEGLDAGADDYLSKPFPMEELIARVRALLRRPAGQAPLQLRYEDLRLQPERSLLQCGDGSVLLPQTEMQILEALMKAAGEPVRRSALEAAAWGLQDAVTPGALDVALHRLRKKLRLLASRVQILNRRAIGYALASSVAS